MAKNISDLLFLIILKADWVNFLHHTVLVGVLRRQGCLKWPHHSRDGMGAGCQLGVHLGLAQGAWFSCEEGMLWKAKAEAAALLRPRF